MRKNSPYQEEQNINLSIVKRISIRLLVFLAVVLIFALIGIYKLINYGKIIFIIIVMLPLALIFLGFIFGVIVTSTKR